MFVDTGLEYPELREFVKSVENVTWVRPEMNFKTVIQTYGYPIVSKEISQVIEEARRHETTGKYTYRIKRLNGELLDKNGNKSIYNCEKWKFLLEAPFLISNKCCNVMKKKPAKKYEKETGNHPIIGTMACESQARKTAWNKRFLNISKNIIYLMLLYMERLYRMIKENGRQQNVTEQDASFVCMDVTLKKNRIDFKA